MNITHTDLKINPKSTVSAPAGLVGFLGNEGIFQAGDGLGKSKTSLPCLYSNNSIENPKPQQERPVSELVGALSVVLSPYHKKQAESLYLNVSRLVDKEAKSPNHIGFLTLTFPDNVTDYKEASRRFNSLLTNFLKPHPDFGHWICTKEQQRRGAWHFHLLICLSEDIKTGINFEELENGKYTSASPFLRGIWKDLREAMPKYNFGRSELHPIKSNAEGMGRYMGKYISKHINQRDEDSKGARLISYSRGWPRSSMKMSWNNENSQQWRKCLSLFAKYNGCEAMYQLTEKLGPGWAYKYQDEIVNVHRMVIDHGEKEIAPHVNPVLKETVKNKALAEYWILHKQNTGGYTNADVSDRRESVRKFVKSKNKVLRDMELIKTGVPDRVTEKVNREIAEDIISRKQLVVQMEKEEREKTFEEKCSLGAALVSASDVLVERLKNINWGLLDTHVVSPDHTPQLDMAEVPF